MVVSLPALTSCCVSIPHYIPLYINCHIIMFLLFENKTSLKNVSVSYRQEIIKYAIRRQSNFELLCNEHMFWGKHVLNDRFITPLWWVHELYLGFIFSLPILGLPGCSRLGQRWCRVEMSQAYLVFLVWPHPSPFFTCWVGWHPLLVSSTIQQHVFCLLPVLFSHFGA